MMKFAIAGFSIVCLVALISTAGPNAAFASQPKASEEKAPAVESHGSTAKHEAAEAKTGEVHDAVELTRDVIKGERKAIIAGTLNMTAEESQAFWPVYRDYENDISKVNDRLLAVIKDYAKNYDILTDEQAKTIPQSEGRSSESEEVLREEVREGAAAEKIGQVLPGGEQDQRRDRV